MNNFESLKIVTFATLAAISYGILHDQVTAHVCVEYFTIAHPPIFPTTSPFLLAIGWGIIATWWVGLPLGIGLALAAKVGRTRRLTLAELRRPIIKLMLFSACCALLAGATGAALEARNGNGPGFWVEVIPREKWVAFSFDMWAHGTSYAAGLAGGLFLIGHTVWRRWRPKVDAE